MANSLNKKNVADITERMRDAKAIVMVDYKGINVEEVNSLRTRMRVAGVDYFVAKNTLIKISLNNLGITELDDALVGPTAIAISKVDEVMPARELKSFISENFKDKTYPSFKFAYITGTVFDREEIIALAGLPSREQLIAEVLCGLNSPITGLVFTLKGIIEGFVYTVKGISER